MADEPTTDRRAIGDLLAGEAGVAATRFWLGEIAKIEEDINGDGARWSILKSAMQGIARGAAD